MGPWSQHFVDPNQNFESNWPKTPTMTYVSKTTSTLTIEVIGVTPAYPQDGGWGALLLRLLRLHTTLLTLRGVHHLVRNRVCNIKLLYMQNNYT